MLTKKVDWARVLGCVSFAVALGWGHLAEAQTFPQPPIVSSVDQNGVDLINGTFNLPGLNIGIGGNGSSLGRTSQGIVDNPMAIPGDIDNLMGGISADSMVVAPGPGKSVVFFRASYNGATYSFVMGTPGDTAVQFFTGWMQEMGGGALLKCDAPLTQAMTKVAGQTCTLKLTDGTMVHYDVNASTGIPWAAIDTVTKPDGEVLKFDYYKKTDTPGYPLEWIKAVKTVTSSLGWALRYSVDSDYRVTDIVAVNSSTSYCDLAAVSCGSASDPRATLTTSGAVNTISRNGVAQLSYSTSGYNVTITSPSGMTKTVVRTHSLFNGVDTYLVQSVTVNGKTWNYDWGGYSVTVTAPDGSTHSLAYNSSGVTSTTDEAGRITKYERSGTSWGGKSYLMKAIAPDATYSGTTLTGGYTAYAYDTRGNLTTITTVPKNGAPGGVIDATKAMVASATYSPACDDTNYKYCNKPLTVTDTNGVITTYTYDAASSQVATMTMPPSAAGGVAPQTRYTYAPVIPHVRNAGGTFDASPSVWRLSSTSTCMTLATCSDSSNPVDQLKTSYTYETSHALPVTTTVTHGNSVTATTDTMTTTLAYDNNGDIIVNDGPQSGAIDESYIFYDALRRPVGTLSLDPDGTGVLKRKAAKTTYDIDGRVISSKKGVAGTGLIATYSGSTSGARWTQASTDWLALTTQAEDTTEYSSTSGLPVVARHYDGGTLTYLTQRSYNSAFRVDCVAQRLNPAIFTTVTATAACTLGTAGSGGADRIVKYVYDVLGNVISTTSGYGTPNGRVDFLKSFDNATATSTGNLSWVEDAKGNRTTYSYDLFNRLIKTCYPSKTTIHSSSTTDCEQIGYRMTTLAGVTQAGTLPNTGTLRDGQVNTLTYDNIGRMISKAGPVSEGMTYDNFNQKKTHTQNGVTETYIYDTAGWMLSDAQGMGTVTYYYDPYGQRSQMTYPGAGLYVTYTYNTGGYLTAIKENGNVNLATYVYDDYSRPTGASLGNGYSTAYSYDANSRLYTQNNTVSGGNNLITLGYSQADQIISRIQSNASYEKTSPVVGTTNLTNNGLNQMATSGSSTLSYDTLGNLSSDGAVSYSYNANNLLLEASTYHLRYDAENRLRVINSDTTTARQFLYDGTDLIAEYNSSGGLSRRYVHGPGTDNPIVWYEGTGTATKYFFQADERGSVTVITNATGITQAVYSYDEYGVPATNSGSLASPFRYTGQVWLPEVGLYYYKARMYAPSLGRFMQTDPIGYSDGMNRYAYVHNDPINAADPTGLCAEIGATDDSGNCHYGSGGLETFGITMESWSTWSYGGQTYGGITSQSQADIAYAAAVNSFNSGYSDNENDYDGAQLVNTTFGGKPKTYGLDPHFPASRPGEPSGDNGVADAIGLIQEYTSLVKGIYQNALWVDMGKLMRECNCNGFVEEGAFGAWVTQFLQFPDALKTAFVVLPSGQFSTDWEMFKFSGIGSGRTWTRDDHTFNLLSVPIDIDIPLGKRPLRLF